MKSHLTLTLIFSMLVFSVLAQEVQGVATYISHRKVDIQMDSTRMNDEMRDRMEAMLRKQFEKEYTLEFTATESMYKEVATLEKPETMIGNGAEVMVVVSGSGAADELYKNVAENRYVNQNELMGKEFLIKDLLELPNWTLTKESKNIGTYTCFKATYTDSRTITRMVSSSENGKIDTKEESEEEEYTVTAWYTPQIPVKHGPQEYFGLPGLILEVSDGTETLLCNKVVLNPKNGVKIKEPTKGKVVSRAEYDEISEKKSKEMQERFQSSRRGEGRSVEIRIGG